MVDHSARSATSRNVTRICPVAPSTATWPKNCLPAIAAAGAKHPVVRANPRPINGPADVMEILKLAS